MTFKNILCRTIFYSMLFKNGFLTISRKLENPVTLFFGVNDEMFHLERGGTSGTHRMLKPIKRNILFVMR